MKRAFFTSLPIILFLLVIGCGQSYPQEIKAEGAPEFVQKNKLQLSYIKNGVGKFEVTIRNNGSAPATTGTQPSFWETVEYQLRLSDGEGTLNESVIGLDLDGNGKKTDTFEVRCVGNATRPYDATIDGIHVYSLVEGDGIFNFSIKGISKYFQLGSDKEHVMWYANGSDDRAFFYFDVFSKYLPSPSIAWILSTWDLITIEYVTISDFRINGTLVEANLTHDTTTIDSQGDAANHRWHIIPNQAFEIGVGEELNLSCIVTATKTVKIDLWLVISWSPDNINRDFWNFQDQGFIATYFQVNESSTTTPTTSTTTSDDTPGFSFFPEFTLILLVTFLIRKKHKRINRIEE